MTEISEARQHLEEYARLRALLDSAVDGIITIDERGLMEAVNPAAEKLFGYTAAEMVGRNVNMLMPDRYGREHDQYLANYLHTGERKIIGIGREVEGRRKDGSQFPLYLAVSEVSFGARHVFTGFVHDLTDLRKAEQQATQLGRILETSLNEIYVFDAETLRFLHVNRGALENVGYSEEQILQLTPIDLKPEFSEVRYRELLAPLRTGQESLLQFETTHQRCDQSRYPVNVRLQRTRWEGREAFVTTVLDLTEQKRVQHELAQRDAQLEFMVEHLPAAAAYVDTAAGIVHFNKVVQRITGYAADELTTIDTCFSRLFRGRARAMRRLYAAYRKQWNNRSQRFVIRRRDNVERVVEFSGYRYDDHEVWLLQDVTDRDRHETELRIRDQAIQSANEGIVIADATREGHPIIFVNRAFEEMSGFSFAEVIGQGCDLLCDSNVGEKSLLQLQTAIANELEFRTTVLCRRKNQEKFWNEVSVAPVRGADGSVSHIVAVMEDISEQRQAQEKLMQSERLAAIGQMVTGLAHESRNALQRAQACLDMLALDLEDQPEQLELTTKMYRALTDLHRHYEEVRNYAAPINLEYCLVDLARLWGTIWRDLESVRFGRAFQLIEPDTDLNLQCHIDEHRIEQVFRNVMENAIAACSDPGCLTIACETLVQSGVEYIEISFRDNGPGFDAETAAQVFQPFFTTKQKGTGLGMAIAQRIVEAHGGQIALGLDTEQGGEVRILLPTGRSPEPWPSQE
ncbi:MAG: PAS domain S-box protein [Fuerstiella sp.]